MKAVARVPPSLRGCASFSPDMGFVQPGSFFDFGLRFRPDPACLARCAQDGWGVVSAPPPTPLATSFSELNSSSQGGKHRTSPSSPEPGVQRRPGLLGHEGNDGGNAAAAAKKGEGEETAGAGGMIVVPLRFDVPGQALPARAVLRARITAWFVEVGCGNAGHEAEAAAGGAGRGAAVVNFGRCFVGQSVSRRVSLKNTSMLPVKFGFVGSPTEVRDEMRDGRRDCKGETHGKVELARRSILCRNVEQAAARHTAGPKPRLFVCCVSVDRTEETKTSLQNIWSNTLRARPHTINTRSNEPGGRPAG